MKSIVPYTKDIKFDSKLAEICSISLEHEMHVNDAEIEGNFIISGEYKSHEVSVNKESFLYKLPFSIDVTDNIVKESIDFEITDFTYEIVEDDILRVDIEFSVTAMEEEKEEVTIDRDAMIDEINTIFFESDEREVEEETIEEEEETMPNIIVEEVEKQEDVKGIDEVRLDQESADLILDSASNKDDEYTTYYIHLVKNGDTLESIISTYQTDITILKKYNSIDNINVGDKIIIPTLDE